MKCSRVELQDFVASRIFESKVLDEKKYDLEVNTQHRTVLVRDRRDNVLRVIPFERVGYYVPVVEAAKKELAK